MLTQRPRTLRLQSAWVADLAMLAVDVTVDEILCGCERTLMHVTGDICSCVTWCRCDSTPCELCHDEGFTVVRPRCDDCRGTHSLSVPVEFHLSVPPGGKQFTRALSSLHGQGLARRVCLVLHDAHVEVVNWQTREFKAKSPIRLTAAESCLGWVREIPLGMSKLTLHGIPLGMVSAELDGKDVPAQKGPRGSLVCGLPSGWTVAFEVDWQPISVPAEKRAAFESALDALLRDFSQRESP